MTENMNGAVFRGVFGCPKRDIPGAEDFRLRTDGQVIVVQNLFLRPGREIGGIRGWMDANFCFKWRRLILLTISFSNIEDVPK